MPHALSTPMPKQIKATVTRSLSSIAPPEGDEVGGAEGGVEDIEELVLVLAYRERGGRVP